MKKIIAQNPFGSVSPPAEIARFGSVESGVLGKILNLFINVLIVVAGIYALINLILAGYSFMAAGDDAQKVAGAWAKIWQTLLGLAVAGGAFVLAAIFGKLLFGSFDALLKPTIPTL
jgi:hypothetical protein